MCPVFNDTADYLLYWHTQKKRLVSGKMNSYKGLHEKMNPSTSVVAENSFFRSQNVGFFNSKLGRAANADRTINLLRLNLV